MCEFWSDLRPGAQAASCRPHGTNSTWRSILRRPRCGSRHSRAPTGASCNGAARPLPALRGSMLHSDRSGHGPRNRQSVPAEPRSRRRQLLRAAAICRLRRLRRRFDAGASPMSTIGCSTPGSRAVRSRGCMTKLCSKSAPIRPGSRPRIFKQAMVDGFVETFPSAPIDGLVEPHIGESWAEESDAAGNGTIKATVAESEVTKELSAKSRPAHPSTCP